MDWGRRGNKKVRASISSHRDFLSMLGQQTTARADTAREQGQRSRSTASTPPTTTSKDLDIYKRINSFTRFANWFVSQPLDTVHEGRGGKEGPNEGMAR